MARTLHKDCIYPLMHLLLTLLVARASVWLLAIPVGGVLNTKDNRREAYSEASEAGHSHALEPSVSGPLYFLSLSVALEKLVLAWYRSQLEK